MKSKIAFILVMAMLFGMLFFVLNDEPSIHDATYEQLIEVEDIGHHYSVEILNYLHHYPNSTIDNLEEIKGIGPKRVKNLKGVFD